MNVSIKKYIMDNFKGVSKEEIKQSIVTSFDDKDEITLPGLGVFFGLVWQKCSDEEKERILSILKDSLN
jgi:small acid-soluble spore protein I